MDHSSSFYWLRDFQPPCMNEILQAWFPRTKQSLLHPFAKDRTSFLLFLYLLMVEGGKLGIPSISTANLSVYQLLDRYEVHTESFWGDAWDPQVMIKSSNPNWAINAKL
uniref:Uncharacterized protein n=1 Tax=Spongospora subterranea TaxID=70186 RepID=A0A0H5QTL6_9EUKA|eukprot:CRZ05260.1 hypothetical protein [Spongospora subterranea]